MFNEFESFIESLGGNTAVCIRITDNVMEPEDWGVDGLIIYNEMVVKQLKLTKGIYSMPNMRGWTTAQVVEWTHHDMTGRHPETYHEVSK